MNLKYGIITILILLLNYLVVINGWYILHMLNLLLKEYTKVFDPVFKKIQKILFYKSRTISYEKRDKLMHKFKQNMKLFALFLKHK